MRISLLIFIMLSMILGGCSSSTLLKAIEKDGNINVEIVIQDDNDNVVLFLNEDSTGQPLLTLNTFVKENSRYKYDSGTGGHAQYIDLSSEYEVINVSRVGYTSIYALWGGVFNYPNAKTVIFTLKNLEGNVIYESEVKITETNIVYKKLPDGFYVQTMNLQYKILDEKNNVLVERSKTVIPH